MVGKIKLAQNPQGVSQNLKFWYKKLKKKKMREHLARFRTLWHKIIGSEDHFMLLLNLVGAI